MCVYVPMYVYVFIYIHMYTECVPVFLKMCFVHVYTNICGP